MEILRSRHKIDRELTTFAGTFSQSANVAVSAVSTSVAQSQAQASSVSANVWHQIMRYLPRFSRAIRRSIEEEFQTAVYGRTDAHLDIIQINQGSGNESWVDLKGVYAGAFIGVLHPVYNSHMQKSTRGSWSEWIAPQDGDYDIGMYVNMVTPDTALDDYVESIISICDPEASWLTPITLAAGTNIAMNTNSRITTNGSLIVRLGRGTRVRFGLSNSGKSVTHASVLTLEVRVSIAKVKLYPPIIRP